MNDNFHFALECKLIYAWVHTVRLYSDILSVSEVMLSVNEREITKFIGLNAV
jgi:hypothetical protein